ncbi:RICIN domain-containing protein [Kitasatospora sp. NPDC056446]|uniref:RICIN domain-containing protein n=1 Tax=Kitasatospora sp. NPDC056446 TaxID=3345819 RepID=UPI0036BE8520
MKSGGWKRNGLRGAVVALGAVLVLGTQPASARVSEGSYRLVNQGTGKCLEVADWRTDNGAPVRQWDCTGGDSQRWVLVSETGYDSGRWALVNVHSGKCLDVPGGIMRNGVTLQQWDCWYGPGQIWDSPSRPDRSNRTLRVGDMAVEIGGYSTEPGAPAQLWEFNGGWNQRWSAVAAG